MAAEAPAAGARARANWTLVLTVAALVLAVVLVAASAVLAFVAYERQSERLDELRAESRRLAAQRERLELRQGEIGRRYAQQAKQLERARASARSAYRRGFVAGRRLERLPPQVRPLMPYVDRGYLVPRTMPLPLRDERPAVSRRVDGYTLRWRALTLFASRRQALAEWTRRGSPTPVRLGPRWVLRVAGPTGIVYAWRTRNRTYAVVSRRERGRTARQLVAAMG